MNGKALQLTLREMQLHFSNPRVLAGLAVVGLVLGLAGPFGTYEALGPLQRLAYWLAVAILTYATGVAASLMLINGLGMTIARAWLRVLVFGTITGVPVTGVVLCANLVTFGAGWAEAIDPLVLWFDATLVGMGVMTVSEIMGTALRRAAAGETETAGVPAPVGKGVKPLAAATVATAGREPGSPALPPILERVPLPQRGALWALVVEDHYVEVITSRGRTLVLMRLSDAMRETGGVEGLQIHRSHWVALGAVQRLARDEGRPAVELPDGRRLGISRGYLPAARAAGLLPP